MPRDSRGGPGLPVVQGEAGSRGEPPEGITLDGLAVAEVKVGELKLALKRVVLNALAEHEARSRPPSVVEPGGAGPASHADFSTTSRQAATAPSEDRPPPGHILLVLPDGSRIPVPIAPGTRVELGPLTLTWAEGGDDSA